MCILSLINKFSANSAQILFTLHKSSKIHHTLYLHSTNSPYRSINRWIGNLFFWWVEGAGGVEDGEDHYAYVGEYGEPEGG